jgi:predicted nucleotidyltransferase
VTTHRLEGQHVHGRGRLVDHGDLANLPHEKIAEFCRKWNVSEFALFGSVLRDDFRPDSDVDVLVSFPSYEATPSLFDHVDMQDELAEIFGRPVDLVSKKGVEESENRFWKKAILESARVVYAS